jgi:hypothetical protein
MPDASGIVRLQKDFANTLLELLWGQIKPALHPTEYR